jgi:hypothetical protein
MDVGINLPHASLSNRYFLELRENLHHRSVNIIYQLRFYQLTTWTLQRSATNFNRYLGPEETLTAI